MRQSSSPFELNLSSLTPGQKQMCVKLLAKSQIDFHEKENTFVAQVKIDPQVFSQAQGQKKNKICNNSGKKLLARTVKIGKLTHLEQLHSNIEVYVYPRKYPWTTFIEIVEKVYQKFWNQHRHSKMNSEGLRAISFPVWFHHELISTEQDKIRQEQSLVSFIESLNHYSPKHLGAQIFYGFLSEEFSTDVLCYFLIIRNLLQQILHERIFQRNTKFNQAKGQLKMDPHQKAISEEQVLSILDILIHPEQSRQKNSHNIRESLYQEIIKTMFYDELKGKNFINFFDLIFLLLNQFRQRTANLQIESEMQSSASPSLQHTFFDQPLDSSILKHSNSPQGQDCLQITKELKWKYEIEAEKSIEVERIKQFGVMFCEEVNEKVKHLYERLGLQVSERTKARMRALVSSLVESDKKIMLREYCMEERHLYEIERLQKEYSLHGSNGVLMEGLCGKVLRSSFIRDCICQDLSFS